MRRHEREREREREREGERERERERERETWHEWGRLIQRLCDVCVTYAHTQVTFCDEETMVGVSD